MIDASSDNEQDTFVGGLVAAINAKQALEIDVDSPIADAESDRSVVELSDWSREASEAPTKRAKEVIGDFRWDSDGSDFPALDHSELVALEDGSEGSDIPYCSGDVDSDVERIRHEPKDFKEAQVLKAKRNLKAAQKAMKIALNLDAEGDLRVCFVHFVSCADFDYISTDSDSEPPAKVKAIPSRSSTTSRLPTMKRKSPFPSHPRKGKKPKSKATISDSDKAAKARSPDSEGESEISEVVVVAAPKAKGKAKAKDSKAKAKATEDVKATLPKELGDYDPAIHTLFEDRCKVCSKRDSEDACYFITANMNATRLYYEARRLGKPRLGSGNRPNNHACIRCIHGRKGDCIAPSNRLIVGPDFLPTQAYKYKADKAMPKSYFLHKYFGRDEAGNPHPDFHFDLEKIKAESSAAYPNDPDVTEAAPTAGNGRSNIKKDTKEVHGKVGTKVKKVPVVEIVMSAAGSSSRAVPEFVEGSSAQGMVVDEAAADAQMDDAEMNAE